MYKKQSKQISMTDFNMPLGMMLDPENRWVKKAGAIPWEAIERGYAELFSDSIKGNVAKPLRLALGALLIQTERGISDTETALQIQETPCLQYFCGLPGYTETLPFDPSLMVHFRKRITPEMLGEINEMVIAKASERMKKDDPPSPPGGPGDSPQNRGDLIIDSTCAPQNIRHPQDISLLNEARENLEAMIDELHRPGDGEKPRTYRKNARRDYLAIAKRRNKTGKEIRKAIGRQLGYVRRDLNIVGNYLLLGRKLPEKRMERLAVIHKIYEQQLCMHGSHSHQAADRIVSLSQPWVRPIVRGKAAARTEFGAKLCVSVSGGFARLDRTSFDAYNEGVRLIESIEKYREREGCYPARVLADAIFRNRENLRFCREKGIHVSGRPLGRPRKEPEFDRRQLRKEEIERIEVERKFSHAKGSFGLGLVRTKLKETSKTAIALAILALNIAYVMRVFRGLFQKAMEAIYWMARFMPSMKNVAFVQ
jgi:hypothetical protein